MVEPVGAGGGGSCSGCGAEGLALAYPPARDKGRRRRRVTARRGELDDGKVSTGENLQAGLLSRTPPFGLRLWIVLGISIWAAILFVLGCICFFLIYWRKRGNRFGDIAEPESPNVTKEIAVDEVRNRAVESINDQEIHALSSKERQTKKDSRKMLAHFLRCKSSDNHNLVGCSSMYQNDKAQCSYSSDEGTSGHNDREYSQTQYATVSTSPRLGLPEFSHLGWGHWFTLRDLELATNGFSDDNIIGEGGYGVVYHGHLINGTEVAVKKLFNNIGQAEKEFRVEVESIGHVRHKNLVRLLGYCIEGSYRMLVYEYINNGNLEQWLHGAMSQHGVLTWEARIKIILDIAKALAYLHEGLEPKVIHRDIKSSNILIDTDFTGKLSDFGLSKLLGSGKSHITTRVMGTFGYVAPEYANTGMLNEKSDVYSFGVLLLEAVTGRDPVNYGRPSDEVHLLEWIKMMASSRRAEEVVDPAMEAKPTKRQLRRALVAALKCVDPKADKRPTMGNVVRMLEVEADDVAPSREFVVVYFFPLSFSLESLLVVVHLSPSVQLSEDRRSPNPNVQCGGGEGTSEMQ
uniref:non-specific serine/threonine protein kinase n=1 Tax=Leersia perrieri TaxID=77586 RepID=A0A0D9V2M2_9ORYZ